MLIYLSKHQYNIEMDLFHSGMSIDSSTNKHSKKKG